MQLNLQLVMQNLNHRHALLGRCLHFSHRYCCQKPLDKLLATISPYTDHTLLPYHIHPRAPVEPQHVSLLATFEQPLPQGVDHVVCMGVCFEHEEVVVPTHYVHSLLPFHGAHGAPNGVEGHGAVQALESFWVEEADEGLVGGYADRSDAGVEDCLQIEVFVREPSEVGLVGAELSPLRRALYDECVELRFGGCPARVGVEPVGDDSGQDSAGALAEGGVAALVDGGEEGLGFELHLPVSAHQLLLFPSPEFWSLLLACFFLGIL